MFQNWTGPDYRKPDRKNRTSKPGPEFVRAKKRTEKTGPDEKTGKPGAGEQPEKPDRENREGNTNKRENKHTDGFVKDILCATPQIHVTSHAFRP